MNQRRPFRASVVALAAAVLLAGCTAKSAAHRTQATPNSTVSSYLNDWSHQAWQEMGSLVRRPPGDYVALNAGAFADLGVTKATFRTAGISKSGTDATVPVTEVFTLRALGTWKTRTTLRLAERAGRWRVEWAPETINPALGPGDHFSVTYVWPPRATILGAGGAVLADQQAAMVTIGLRGRYIKDPASLASALTSAGATSSEVTAAISAAEADPSAFQPVFRVTMTRYEQLKPALYSLPGTFFQTTGGGGASDPYLAALVGQLGTITKAQLKTLGAPYTAASIIGQTGLEGAYQSQLAGTAGGTVTVVGPPASASSGAGGSGSGGSATSTTTGGSSTSTTSTSITSPAAGRTMLVSFPPKPGRDVRTSIVPNIEKAAGRALDGERLDAALVAINTKTSEVVAVANDAASGGFDLGLDGEQPPGSTFKVITSTALILHGLSPASAATCPPTIDVDGEILHNAGNETPVSNMLEAFTESCNTAYIGLTMANLNASSLHKAAALYGIGTPPLLGPPAFGGSVPIAKGQTDLAASAIGQAEVVLSPLDLAMVAADVDSGVVRAPRLVVGAPADHAPKHVLPRNLVADLHKMMLSVVESGTAAGTGLPPGTYAKTGTAEYGSGNPLPVDAWLMGFNGHIAFTMIVINSPGDGGPIDGPVVARFFNALGARG
jgi:cell division protein FtsI/penicillin-binding protein 2